MQNPPISDIRDLTPGPASRGGGRPLIALAAVAVVALVLWVLRPILHVALVAFAGVLLAVFLRGVAGWMHRHTRVPMGYCLAVVLCSIVAAIGLGAWLLAPSVAAQIDALSADLSAALAQLGARLERYGWGRELLSRLSDQGSLPQIGPTIRRATTLVSGVAGVATGVLVYLVVGIYMAADPRPYRRGLLRLIPVRRRAEAGDLLDELGEVLRRWLIGRIFSMAVIGVSTGIGLVLLDMPLALTLALLAAFLTFIPNIGPLLALLPAVLLGLMQGPGKAAAVLALYLGVQLVESYLLTPLVQRRAVQLPPALLIVAQVLLGVLGGALGLLVATPLCAVALVLVRRIYVEGVLGDTSPGTDRSSSRPDPRREAGC